MHVTIRVVRAAQYLRTAKLYRALRRATFRAAVRGLFRIVHVSVQQTHVHLLVEARHRDALARGMQGFEVSAARRINRALDRRGQVFVDRYHAHVLRTPSETRRALNYVMNNWRKHGEAAGKPWVVDPYSTGYQFDGWRERLNSPTWFRAPPGLELLFVIEPDSWLLEFGWRRYGLIGVCDEPGPRASRGAARHARGARSRSARPHAERERPKRQRARTRLFFGACSSSTRPSASSTGGT